MVATSQARRDLRQLLVEIDGQDPELREKALAAGMRPISDWEVYPDPKQAFRLPLASGRITLLEKPYEKVGLRKYVDWQTGPTYCSVDGAMQAIFNVIVPINAPPPKGEKKSGNTGASASKAAPDNVFGPIKGRYAQVLVDFWNGVNNPPDSLNAAIILTARMMPYYFHDAGEAVYFIEELIDALPDVAFSDRLSGGKRNEVSRVVRQSIGVVYNGNRHQRDPELSNAKLAKVFKAWQRKGFSLVDRTTWGKCGSGSSVVVHDTFSWSADDIPALTYLAKILHVDVSTASDATRQLLCGLSNHTTGEMTVTYVKKGLVDCGIKCGHHGKVNEYISALAQAGWIEQVAAHVVKRRGRCWRIGERMRHKFATIPSTLTTNPLPHLSLDPIINNEEVALGLGNPFLAISEADLATAMRGCRTETSVVPETEAENGPVDALACV